MDLRLNVPPQPPEAALQDRMASAFEALQKRNDFLDLLNYGPTEGRGEDREAAAVWLRPLLGEVSAGDVVICAGGVSLLVALVTTFAERGDTIVTERLTYPGIRAVSRHFGMRLEGIATDDEGIIPSDLADVCRRTKPKILYCTPTIQNPTTATMSLKRRSEIAAVAEHFDLTILEDDAYGMLPEAPMPPIASMAPERTFYLASLSKCLTPGLRLAYCVGPRARKAQMTEGVRVATFLAPRLMAAIVSQLIEDGSAAKIRDAIRRECAARQATARKVLGRDFAANAHGPHLWLSTSAGLRIPELGAYLREHGVPAKGDGFAVGGEDPNGLRICLGALRTREELVRSLEFLKETLREPPNCVC